MDTPTPSFMKSNRSLRERDIPTRISSSTPANPSRLRKEIWQDPSPFVSKQMNNYSSPLRDTSNINRRSTLTENNNNGSKSYPQSLFEKKLKQHFNDGHQGFASPHTKRNPTFTFDHKPPQNAHIPVRDEDMEARFDFFRTQNREEHVNLEHNIKGLSLQISEVRDMVEILNKNARTQQHPAPAPAPPSQQLHHHHLSHPAYTTVAQPAAPIHQYVPVSIPVSVPAPAPAPVMFSTSPRIPPPAPPIPPRPQEQEQTYQQAQHQFNNQQQQFNQPQYYQQPQQESEQQQQTSRRLSSQSQPQPQQQQQKQLLDTERLCQDLEYLLNSGICPVEQLRVQASILANTLESYRIVCKKRWEIFYNNSHNCTNDTIKDNKAKLVDAMDHLVIVHKEAEDVKEELEKFVV